MPNDAPSWYAKAFKVEGPAGIVALLLTSGALGAAGAGGVEHFSQPADMAAIDARVDARMDAIVDQMRREAASAAEAAEALSGARYDEILRRLDRIERRLDTSP